MKNSLYFFLAFFTLLLMSNSVGFAGIPIQESPIIKDEVIVKEQQQKSTKRVSKLKQKIAKKLLRMDVEEGENKVAAIVFAILIPFVGVAIYQDKIGRDFWITLGLTVLGFLPGMIYALSVVLKRLK